LPGKRSIAERPIEVERREHIGHWEGDTVMGRDLRHCVLTLSRAQDRLRDIKKLRSRSKDEVTRAATRAIRSSLPSFKTLTLDNGTEFHDYALLEQALSRHHLLRDAISLMGARLQRKLQWAAATIFAKRHLHAPCHPGTMHHIADDLNHRPRKRHTSKPPAGYILEIKLCCTCSLNLAHNVLQLCAERCMTDIEPPETSRLDQSADRRHSLGRPRC